MCSSTSPAGQPCGKLKSPHAALARGLGQAVEAIHAVVGANVQALRVARQAAPLEGQLVFARFRNSRRAHECICCADAAGMHLLRSFSLWREELLHLERDPSLHAVLHALAEARAPPPTRSRTICLAPSLGADPAASKLPVVQKLRRERLVLGGLNVAARDSCDATPSSCPPCARTASR